MRWDEVHLKYPDELENAQVRLLLVTSNLLHSDACLWNVRGGRTATGVKPTARRWLEKRLV